MNVKHKILFIYPGESREERLGGIDNDLVPKEFFYGFVGLRDKGFDVRIADSRKDPAGIIERFKLNLEIRRNSLINFGGSSQRVIALKNQLLKSDIAISFTDGFSLSMGLYRDKLGKYPILAGGFHGLSDMIDLVHPGMQWYVKTRINKAIAGLDHIFFFGEPDRQQAIKLYDLPEGKTSLFPFGIDTDFWFPSEMDSCENFILSVGSDRQRDYATLIAAPIELPIRIVTKLPVNLPIGKNIEIIKGNYYGSTVTDVMLREIYQKAKMVVVPLKDVFQPTGCSVTLQAMACGKPVVLSDIKGLWDREVFISGRNCILVSPGRPQALAAAVNELRSNSMLCREIGSAARQTALEHFNLARMDAGIEQLCINLARQFLIGEPALQAG